jgi:hypothetical protein
VGLHRSTTCTLLLVLAGLVGAACREEPAPATPLRGTYLGQTEPGDTPLLFAPGVVSTGLYERDLAITPDGREIYFCVVLGNYQRTSILVTRRDAAGDWSTPEVAPFSGKYKDLEPAISPDGLRLYFASHRPHTPGDPAQDSADIWVAERAGDGWGEPTPLAAPVNTDGPEFFPSVTRDGTLYFTRDFPGGASAIFRARPVDGGFGEPERLGAEVNSVDAQFNSYVAPDESYLIYGAYGREDSLGATDYYASFRNDDDSWTGPIHLGDRVNSASGLEYSPFVTPDGRYFFFMASRSRLADEDFAVPRSQAEFARFHRDPGNGLPDIWWVDASFIEALRPAL